MSCSRWPENLHLWWLTMMNNYDGRVTRDMWHNDVTSGQYWPFVSCCQFDLKLFLNSKQTFPACVGWKSNKKANIGKYFILGIQGTIDIITTWTWLTWLTQHTRWGSAQCLLISFPQPLHIMPVCQSLTLSRPPAEADRLCPKSELCSNYPIIMSGDN